MFKSIRRRLIFNFVLLSAVILICNGGFMTVRTIIGLENQMKYDGLTLANTIKSSIQYNDVTNLETLQGMLEDVHKQSNGSLYYVGLINAEKKLVAGSAKEAIGQTIDNEEIDKVFEGETLNFMNEWKGISAYNVMIPLNDGNEVVACISVGISVKNMTESVGNSIKEAIMGGVVILVLAALLGVILGRRIAKPIESIKNTVERVGAGDLTAEYQVKGKDEIAMLAKSSNETTANVRDVIRKVKSVSSGLNKLSEQLSNGGEQVYESSESIASAVNNVSEEGSKQTIELEEAVSLLGDFSEDLNRVNDRLNLLSNDGEAIKKDANKGAETISRLQNSIGDMKLSFDVVKNKVQSLDNSISEINSIVDVINSVASQTNLLALNASIEAARAGEAGRGFSVVADEIRKLAEEVLNSSKNITELVNKVMSETDDASKTTDLASKNAENSEKDVAESIEIFSEIIKKVNSIPQEIDGVHAVLNGTMTGREKIQYTVENIAANSEEITSLTEEVTASAEEQTTITEELAKYSRKLSKMSNALANSISDYDV